MIETAKQEAAPMKRKRRVFVKTSMALIFAALIIAALVTVRNLGGGLSIEGAKRMWTVITGGAGDANFIFEEGFDSAFADLGGAVVAAGSTGVVVYDGNGAEVARDVLAVQHPTVASGAGVAVAYGVGGRGVRVADRTGIIASLTFENDIISCSVGTSSGVFAGGTMFAVCTKSSGGYRGQVIIYRLAGSGPEEIYRWFSGEGYVLSAEIAPGNNEFAVLTLTPEGGRIVLLSRTGTDVRGEYIERGAAIIEMGYLKSGTLIARTADGLTAIDSAGGGTRIYSFGEKVVAGYCDAGESSLAAYLESGAGGSAAGELVIIDERGIELGKMSTSRSLVWLSSYTDRIAVLWDDGLGIYDRSMRLVVSYPEASGMRQGYSRGASRAVVFGNREGRAFSGRTD
ncbi:MAG: hypothetical protein GX823_04025 [Clostridiales bacterium]|nr:hypothetical protein [Clostridiales bacterium]